VIHVYDETGNVVETHEHIGDFLRILPRHGLNLLPMTYTPRSVAICFICVASVALADDFKTIDGKEYKNAKLSRVEPDGIVITFSGGIVKIPFTELSADVQKKYGYDSSAAATYSAAEYEKQAALAQQRKADEQQRLEERQKYWSENPTPKPVQKLTTFGSGALDRPANGQAMSAWWLVTEYATNHINADRLYTGQRVTISGTIKSIDPEQGGAVVELFVPDYIVGKAWFMHCIFSDSRELEQYRAGNSIGLIGTVAGLDGRTLTVKDCQLAR
jgi:hypothetical protein